MEATPCYCRRMGKLRTTWTATNPGRRFIGCERCEEAGGCGFFVWYDPPMYDKSKHVILGLLQSLRRHDEQQRLSKKREKIIWVALFCSWTIFILTWVLYFM
ncbi:unnamed protein product [Ilex paraguariensis]|uniref:GRF-type domain-containing protein n=1 Tax=Ilex paraguariensis TaxID=185542 RepID=A0ABC8U691_9AQUA